MANLILAMLSTISAAVQNVLYWYVQPAFRFALSDAPRQSEALS
jgi:hypothetical protein